MIPSRPARSPRSRSIRSPTCTAPRTTSARWWRCSCDARCGSPPPGRSAVKWRSGTGMPSSLDIRLTVNGRAHALAVPAHALLLDVLRDRLDLRGAKRSCDMQVCGACTVLVDGKAVSSCTYLAVEADGCEVLTVEGLADGERLHPLQQAFLDHGAVQCGFCTSGMLMTA